MGIASDYVNFKQRTKEKTFRKNVLALKMKEDNLAEELRVLYVALTRAKEKLIMTGTLSKMEEKLAQELGRAPQGLHFADYMKAGSYLDLILPILDENVLDIRLVSGSDLYSGKMVEQLDLGIKKQQLREADQYADSEVVGMLQERFAYRYAYENLGALYTKTTVSELKIAAMADKDEQAFHAFEEAEVVPYIPGFRREEEVFSATARGNAYHKVMELLEFEELYKGLFPDPDGEPENMALCLKAPENQCVLKHNFRAFVDRKAAEGVLSEEYRSAISIQKCTNFLSDPLAIRMWKAQKQGVLYKEQPFVLGVDALRLNKEFPEDEKVLIQGIVDAYFVENGGIVLVDYKTDKVINGRELWQRYETQLEYYEEALCKLMNLPVREKVLYSFGLERCVTGAVE